MIYYPLETLCKAGVRDIMVVTGGNSAGDFLKLLGNGRDFGLDDIAYTYQEDERGPIHALKLCEHFCDGERFIVMLGDNILEDDISPYVRAFENQGYGGRLILKKVDDAHGMSVAEIDEERVLKVHRPAVDAQHPHVVTGTYMYDQRVFEFIRWLTDSDAETEMSDANDLYIQESKLCQSTLPGWWGEAGTLNGLLAASDFVAGLRGQAF